jgi:hypothetical protein
MVFLFFFCPQAEGRCDRSFATPANSPADKKSREPTIVALNFFSHYLPELSNRHSHGTNYA